MNNVSFILWKITNGLFGQPNTSPPFPPCFPSYLFVHVYFFCLKYLPFYPILSNLFNIAIYVKKTFGRYHWEISVKFFLL